MTTRLQRKNQPFKRNQVKYLGNDQVRVLSCDYSGAGSYGWWITTVKHLTGERAGEKQTVDAWRLKDYAEDACKFCLKMPCACSKLSYAKKLSVLHWKLQGHDWYACMSDSYSVCCAGERNYDLLKGWAAKWFKQSVLDAAWKKYGHGVSAPKSEGK